MVQVETLAPESDATGLRKTAARFKYRDADLAVWRKFSRMGYEESTMPGLPALLNVYDALQRHCSEQSLTTKLFRDVQLTTLFRRPVTLDELHSLRVHERPFGSRFTLSNAMDGEIAMSGSYRCVDTKTKAPVHPTRIPPCNSAYLELQRELFSQSFPHIRAQWIFWAALGAAKLMQSDLPRVRMGRYLSSRRADTGRFEFTHHDVRLSSSLLRLELDDLDTSGHVQIRVAEPEVVSGAQGLIGSFTYEVVGSHGPIITMQTGLRLRTEGA